MKTIAIVGPTASGKTDIAIKIAQMLNGEIISADSRLVYKDFNIGTAKPTIEERCGIQHYLIDVVNPEESFNAGLYKELAEKAIQRAAVNGKLPIVAGGTGFYVKSLLEGLGLPGVGVDVEFREEMRVLAEAKGAEFLHDKLAKLDPVIAEKIHPNNVYRVIRALEVCNSTGKAMSEIQSVDEQEYEPIYIGLTAENRDYLYERVNKRVDLMIEQGLVEEVENLIEKYGKTISMMKTLGYKEICNYLEGEYDFERAVELIKQKTRNFAKRQLTWFRANKNIHWFYIDKMTKEEICKEAVKLYDV